MSKTKTIIDLGDFIKKPMMNYCVLFDKTCDEIIEFAKAIKSSDENPIFVFVFCTTSIDDMDVYKSLINNELCYRVIIAHIGNIKNKFDVVNNYIKFLTNVE